jgi:hypothetical protein
MHEMQPIAGQPEFALAIASMHRRRFIGAPQGARLARLRKPGGIRRLNALLARAGALLIALGRKLQEPLLGPGAQDAYLEPCQPRLAPATTACPSEMPPSFGGTRRCV